jgi:uncharacterized protein
MTKKVIIFCILALLLTPHITFISHAVTPGSIYQGEETIVYRNLTVYAPAVASTDEGYIGVLSTITVSIQNQGSGRVFVDTLPLTQIDMQGSARLAVNVAQTVVEKDQGSNVSPSEYDYFFVVRTSSPIIGGPSAGAVMTLAVICLLENWTIDDKLIMTGMINPDGGIGPIGGILEKIDAAASAGATRFLIPAGQGTYTKTVTETVTTNGWPHIVTRQQTYDVSEYAWDNYNIDVIEVADIYDVVFYATGMVFDFPDTNGTILTEDYRNSMEPLASSLLSSAQAMYANASNQRNLTAIPQGYPFYYSDQIDDMLDSAATNVQDAEVAYAEELFYSSTSNSFQSLINSRFVLYACGYFNADNEASYVGSVLDDALSEATAQSATARDAVIDGLISLQCVGAAQQRASEATTYLDEAQTDFESNDYLTALYKIAYAVERTNSVGWWLSIESYYNESGEISNENLSHLAGEYIEESQQAVVYSGVILDEIGETSSYLTAAEDLLQSARDNYEKNYPAAAFFEALEALVKANLAIELIDGVSDEQLTRARDNARQSIILSRSQGIEPVLAISYYEYAKSLENASEDDTALGYYRLSDIIAGALEFTSISASISSRYLGIPERPTSVWKSLFSDSLLMYLLFIVIGGIGGLGVGLILGVIIAQKGDKDAHYKKWMPRSIEDYYKKH